MVLQSFPRRIGIFVFYNADGDVSSYVTKLLENITPHLSRLIITINGYITPKSLKILETFTSEIFVRENSGLDAAAYKKSLLYYCGLDSLKEFDEVILFNDTFYGPFISFQEIFEQMDKKDIDFWGIQAGYKSIDGWGVMPDGFIPDHIQSWFWSFRRTLTESSSFQEYWKNYDESLNSFIDVVTKHELIFTKYFSDKGFKWDIFMDSEKYRSEDLNKNYNFYAYDSYSSLVHMNMPFLKRKPFHMPRHERLYMSAGEDLQRSLNYIKKYTSYDLSYIYEDLLKNGNVYDIYDSLNLNYILPFNESNLNDKLNDCVIIIYCSSLERIKKIEPYVKNLKNLCDVYLILPESIQVEIKKLAIQCKLVFVNNTLVGIPALIKSNIDFSSYKYIGFTHDASYYLGDLSDTIYSSIFYNLFENIIKNSNYIMNIKETFEENPQLGLLESPPFIHNEYFNNFLNTWDDYFEPIQEFCEKLQLKVNLDKSKEVISYGGGFWFRKETLEQLFIYPFDLTELSSQDIPFILERLLPFIGQNNGFFTGIVMNSDYASLHLRNQEYYLREALKLLNSQNIHKHNNYRSFLEEANRSFNTPISTLYKRIKNLETELNQKEGYINILYPLTSLKTQIRLRLKRVLPKPFYKIIVCTKRCIFGPHHVPFSYDD